MSKISISIDTAKIKKEWLVKGKEGRTYLAIDVYSNDAPYRFDQTHSVKQTIPKELRDAFKATGEKVPYIGNGKDFDLLRSGGESAQHSHAPSRARPTEDQMANLNNLTDSTEDVPF